MTFWSLAAAPCLLRESENPPGKILSSSAGFGTDLPEVAVSKGRGPAPRRRNIPIMSAPARSYGVESGVGIALELDTAEFMQPVIDTPRWPTVSSPAVKRTRDTHEFCRYLTV